MRTATKDIFKIPMVDAKGESLGKIRDLLFEDREWKIRYLVVDTGNWLHDRLTLVTPEQALVSSEALEKGKIPCTLDKITIEGCPPLDVDAPVSRRYEIEFAKYYNASPYWLGSPVWGIGDASAMVPPPPEKEAEHDRAMEEIERCHLRSAHELEGYEVFASNDVSLGSVDHLDFEWKSGRVINIVAREGGLLHTKEERNIIPQNVQKIDWQEKRIYLSMPYEDDRIVREAAEEVAPGAGVPAAQF